MINALSKKQLACLAQIAHKAWVNLVASGAESGDWRDEQEWRHAMQEEVLGAGRTSLKGATQADYPRLYNYFARLANVGTIKDNTRTTNDKMIYVLQVSLRKQELTTDYLYSIARDKFPRQLVGYTAGDIIEAIRAKLDPEQIRQLLYTINNRGRSKTASLSETHDLDTGTADD